MCRFEQRKPAPVADHTATDAEMKAAVLEQAGDAFDTDVGCYRKHLATFDELAVGHFTVVEDVTKTLTGDVIRCRDKCNNSVAVKKVRNKELQRVEGTEVNERSMHFQLSSKRTPNMEDPSTEIGILMHLKEQMDLPLYVLRLQHVFAEGYDMRGHTWVVMEDCDGGELFRLVERNGPLRLDQTKRYAWQLLQASQYLHGLRIAHRDISLENVLLKNDIVRLMDFGQAVRSHSVGGVPYRYFRGAGKDLYRAPEAWVPTSEEVRIVAPHDARPGQIVTAAVNAGWPAQVFLSQVRLPEGCMPNRECTAEVVGYEACPMDVHAVGVCIFIMLLGNPIYGQAHRSDSSFAFFEANGVKGLVSAWGLPLPSDETFELLEGMLRIDPANRFTVDRALSSSWFNGAREPFVPCHATPTVSDAVMNFAVMGA